MSKDFRRFIGLEDTSAKIQSLNVSQNICSPQKALYGGVGLGLAIEVLEEEYKRPIAMASTQFINQAIMDEEMSIEIQEGTSGKNFTQATAQFYQKGKLVIQTIGSLGRRDSEFNLTYNPFPADVTSPDDSVVLPKFEFMQGYILPRMEIRHVKGPSPFMPMDPQKVPSGTETRSLFWAKLPEYPETSAATLAILGDIAPSVTASYIGEFAIASSLDNSMRVLNVEQCEWVLCETELHGIFNGVGQITQRMWSQQGTLMAVASQSYILRLMNIGNFGK